MNQPRIWVQQEPTYAIYCLQGIPYAARTAMFSAGWTWAKGYGTRGCYITHSAVTATHTADRIHVQIEA